MGELVGAELTYSDGARIKYESNPGKNTDAWEEQVMKEMTREGIASKLDLLIDIRDEFGTDDGDLEFDMEELKLQIQNYRDMLKKLDTNKFQFKKIQ